MKTSGNKCPVVAPANCDNADKVRNQRRIKRKEHVIEFATLTWACGGIGGGTVCKSARRRIFENTKMLKKCIAPRTSMTTPILRLIVSSTSRTSVGARRKKMFGKWFASLFANGDDGSCDGADCFERMSQSNEKLAGC